MAKKVDKKTAHKAASKVASKTVKKVVKKTAAKAAKPTVKKVTKATERAPVKAPAKAAAKVDAKPEKKIAEKSGIKKSCPDFALPNSSNEMVSLKDLKGKKVVLYFYPKDSTPGCTLEGQQFARLNKEFVKENTVILGVSKDSVESHDKFKCKFNFPFELLSDVDGKLCDAFDVIKEKNMYGKKYMGIERSTFIIDENQNIVREFRKISLAGHAEFILDQVKAIS